MHCAVAVNLPGVALFARLPPSLLLPPQTEMQAIYDASEVNNISPQVVAEAIRKGWQRGAG